MMYRSRQGSRVEVAQVGGKYAQPQFTRPVRVGAIRRGPGTYV